VNTFEVFGLDFMIDDEFKIYLIEVNTNPCLELASPLLARLIPNMLENAIKIAVDPLFPPPEGFTSKKAFLGDACPQNNFSLVFDHKIDGPVIENLVKNRDSVISKYIINLILIFYLKLKWTKKISAMRKNTQMNLMTKKFDYYN
jgi:hypothetical protein